jgi:hypothetical protein
MTGHSLALQSPKSKFPLRQSTVLPSSVKKEMLPLLLLLLLLLIPLPLPHQLPPPNPPATLLSFPAASQFPPLNSCYSRAQPPPHSASHPRKAAQRHRS